MSSLLRSIADIWEDTPALCALVPFERVFTGRIPQTQEYRMPYVSIISTHGRQVGRSDRARYSRGPVSFSVWVDESSLEFAEDVAEEISNAYADRCWPLRHDDEPGCGTAGVDKVIDCLDEGEPMAHQVDLPNIKAWEVVKLFSVCIQRARVDRSAECCGDDYSSWSDSSGESSSSSGEDSSGESSSFSGE